MLEFEPETAKFYKIIIYFMYRNNFAIFTRISAIFFYIVLITFSPSIHFIDFIEFHDCQRVIQLLLLAIVLLDGIVTKTSIFINPKLRFSFLTLLVLAILSSATSIKPRYAIIELSTFAALCYLSLFVGQMFIEFKEKFVRYLTYVLWASIGLYMVSFYTGYLTAIVSHRTLEWPYPFYGFSNIRLFQEYQLWSLGFICMPLLAFYLKNRTRYWLYSGLTAWWVLLIYAASRGVILSWTIAMLITLTVYKKEAWPFLKIQAINAITGLCAYLILFKIITFNTIVTSTVFRDMVSDRTDLWKAALVMIKNFPFFGVGPMQFYFHNPFGTHPHNSALQIAAEWGLPATLVIFLIIGYSFYCWMQKFNVNQIKNDLKLHSNFAIILFFTIVANGAYSLVEGVIVMPISQVLMFTIMGLMIGQYIEKVNTDTNLNLIITKSRFRPFFALIVLVFFLSSVMPELVRGITSFNRIMVSNERAFSLAPNTINPRIWMQQRREN